jgi:hypothetical protein
MRSIKRSAASAAAVAVVALAPAAASAAGRHSTHRIRPAAGGICRVTLNVAPRLVTSGEKVAAFGRLTCPTPAERGSQKVVLYEGTTPPYAVAGETTTNAGGEFTIETAPLTSNGLFHVVAGTTESKHRSVKVAAAVTLNGPADGAQLLAGRQVGDTNKVTFTGAVAPEDVGALVVLQREDATSGNEWHAIGFGRVGPGGSYTVKHRFLVPGDANIRVLVRDPSRNAPSPSNVLTYEISQTQNPALTLIASADPILYGEPVTLTGKADVSASETVTLLSHTAHQGSFAPVVQVQTNSKGEYTFPAQSPVYSTFYKVQGGGVSSAVLYEDVGDALTATLSSATTIQAGGTLKLEVSVSPNHSGHVIYLERENPQGTAFHVVQAPSLGSASTYTIEHTIYTTGTSVFRVRIPGDPQNGGAVSQPSTIDVTPASTSALPTETPGNSTQPSEGQV